MQISQMFKRKPCVFSIECFPPKQTANFGKMKDTLRTMRTLNPDFISVTYGAGGSTGGVSTVEVAEFLKNDLNVEPLAHMICMGSDKAKAAQLLDQLNAAGVRNVLTLRGDRMWEFLDRLFNVALPRVRDFRGINANAFDGRGNYALGIKEQLIFPEIEYDKIDKIRGMDIVMCTTAQTDEEARELLTLVGAPFER